MGLESPSFVQDFVTTNPASSDSKGQGDDHIRNMKTALKATFPNGTRAQYFPRYLGKTANYTILSTDMERYLAVDATSGARTMTLPSLGASNDGWSIFIMKVDVTANAVIIGGTVNSTVNPNITTQYGWYRVFWSGSGWLGFGSL